ncbi:TRAP transporter small permease subunit [Paracoccus sp. WLY502]|uniref:TRAP transporter small permease subunit n=1 Tax=Paracoccus yibinensis TaxID=3068891 RepID=UPI002796DEAB|nr:TRAP transporter small permease subunit [Paracoccus sp. WLY502]MDQ1898968.1 TRAP transporter small permease subunit [Paracoccus sp. WLY502]
MNGLLALSRGIDRVNTVIGRNVSWLILLAIFVSAINAVIRKAFSMSSNAWLELQWYLYGAAFLLAAAYTLLENEHIRIDILFGALSRRVQHWIELLGHIFFLMPMVLLTLWLTWPWLARSYRTGEMSMNAGGLILWPAKALLFTGFLLLLFQGISEIIKKIAVMRGIIPDYNAPSGHHAPLDLDEELLKQAGFADPDHPLTDIPADKTRKDDRK